MNELKRLPIYSVLAILSGTALLYYQWPFYQQTMMMALVSVPIMLLLPRKQMPILIFGMLLVSIGYAMQEPAKPLTSIGTYVLLSCFQFSLWSIADQVKQLREVTERLKEQHQTLMLKEGELRVLSLQEFIEQALWLLKTNNRKKDTWLMEVSPAITCPLQTGRLEQAALGAINRERDLVTSKHGAVYLLVQETEKEALQSFLKRLGTAMDSDNPAAGYEIKKTAITEISEMGSLLS